MRGGVFLYINLLIQTFSDQKMDISEMLQQSSQSNFMATKKPSNIIIGYYNIRGKAQVPRLLLEYLEVQYVDKIFTLPEWHKYLAEETQDFAFPVLPFIREGTFVCTESVPICTYIINRFGTQQLLGKSLKDRAMIEMYFWTISYMENVITINCQQKTEQQLKKFKKHQWNVNVYPRILRLEEAASDNRWFLDYLTIVDFSIYQLIRYMDNIFDNETQTFPKLKRIEQEFYKLPQIFGYENSPRAVTEWCPTKLLESFKAAAMLSNPDKSSIESKQKSKQ